MTRKKHQPVAIADAARAAAASRHDLEEALGSTANLLMAIAIELNASATALAAAAQRDSEAVSLYVTELEKAISRQEELS